MNSDNVLSDISMSALIIKQKQAIFRSFKMNHGDVITALSYVSSPGHLDRASHLEGEAAKSHYIVNLVCSQPHL